MGQTLTLKGKIIDKSNQQPVELATVYLTSAKDSTVIGYTISDRNGQFLFKIKPIQDSFYLKVSFIGYQDYKQEIRALSANTDMGSLLITNEANGLTEVVIKNEAPPIRIKKDTLEFNASSFKIRQDANVETLLKQLPGVAIDKDGKITVNGRPVNKILVNGKPFFGNDGKIATQNLPSDLIDKVQVTTTKTREEELSGQVPMSDNKTINLTVKKEKNKGVFGKLMGGAGSNGSYESGGLINYFNDKQKISVLGSSNNINSVGFSMNDIFDAMGGGRVRQVTGDDNAATAEQSGSTNGITRSNIVGANYSDQYFKVMDPTASYFYTSTENENNNRSRFQNLANNTITESENRARTIANRHNINLTLETKIDAMTSLDIKPNYKKSNSRFTSTNTANTIDSNTGILLNDTNGYDDTNSDNNVLNSTISLYRKFKKRGRFLSANFSNQNNSLESERRTNSTTNLYDDNIAIDRNQLEKDNTSNDNYSLDFNYKEPLNDSLTIGFGNKLKYNKQLIDKHTFGYNTTNSDFTDVIAAQTNYMTSETKTFNPFVSVNSRTRKYDAALMFGTEFSKFSNFSRYLGEETRLDKNYFFPSITAILNYNFRPTRFLRLLYDFKINMPSPNQVLPVENLSNPLNTIVGNPDLDPVRIHNLSGTFIDMTMTGTMNSLYCGVLLYEKQIVTSTAYLSSAVQRTTFANVDHTYRGFVGISRGGNIRAKKNSLRYRIDVNNVIGLDKGFYSDVTDLSTPILYESRSYSIIPKVELTWQYGKLLTLAPTYTYNYSITNFKNFLIDKTSYYIHNFNLEATSYWPKDFVIGSDLGYNYNSNIANGFKKDFYLWNVSLGYNFYGNKLLAKVKVYDVLNQNLNATRTVTPTAVQDVENTVLKRYVMFSLTYSIDKFGGKKQ